MCHIVKQFFTLTSLFFIHAQALSASKNDQVEKTQSQTEKNVHFSNTVITQHELIILLGAINNSTTENEITNYINFPRIENKNYVHELASGVFQFLQTTSNNTVLNIANGIFVQNDENLQPTYSSQVQSFYKTDVFYLNFANKSSNATDLINQYVSNHTEGRIKNLFHEPLKTDTQIVVNSALHFSSKWNTSFSTSLTNDSTFNTGSGNVEVEMMSNSGLINYGEIPSLNSTFIRLPYTHSTFEMLIILPNSIQALENAFRKFIKPDPGHYVSKTEYKYVNYKIPKMKFKNFLNVKKVMQEDGVKEVFTDKADLSKILNDKRLKISEVIQAGEIEVNEKGTEANIVEVSKLIPVEVEDLGVEDVAKVFSKSVEEYPKSIDFTVNRPFLLMIHSEGLTSPVFLSAVYNPNKN